MPSQWNVQVGLPEIFSKKTTDKSNFYINHPTNLDYKE